MTFYEEKSVVAVKYGRKHMKVTYTLVKLNCSTIEDPEENNIYFIYHYHYYYSSLIIRSWNFRMLEEH